MRRASAILLACALAGCRASAPAAVVDRVRIAIHRDAIAFLPLRAAETLGYYRDEALNVDLSELGGGTKAIEALLGGSVDVAAGAPSDAVQLAAEGRPVRSFLVLYIRPTLALAAAPSRQGRLRTIADLKGRTIGVSTPGSASHQFLNVLLAENGLSPNDVGVVSVGMSGTAIASLEHDKVDAAVLVASAIATFEDRHPGAAFMADTRSPAAARQIFGAEIFPALGLLAEDRWLEGHAAVARRLARAVTRGLRWVHDHPAGELREMIPQAARTPSERTDLQSIREMQQVISVDGLMPDGSLPAIERFVAVSNPKVRDARIRVADLYTNRFVTAQ